MFEVAKPANGEPVTVTLPADADARASGSASRRFGQGIGIILLGGLVAVMAAIAAMELVPQRYDATLQLLVEAAADGRGAKDNTSGEGDGVTPAEGEVQALQSDAVLTRVIERLDLPHDAAFARADRESPLVEGIKRSFGIMPQEASGDDPAHALDMLRSLVEVRRADQGDVIDVSVRSRDPETAARIANAIGEARRSIDKDARDAGATRITAAASAQLADLRRSMEAAEQRLAAARAVERSPTAVPKPPAVDAQETRQTAERGRASEDATAKLATARARLDRARALETGPAGLAQPEMVRSRPMQALRQRYERLARTVEDLEGQLGERHPTLREARAELRMLSAAVRGRTVQEKDRLVDAAESEVRRAEAARSAAHTIRQPSTQAKPEAPPLPVRSQPPAASRLPELEHDLGAARAAYETAAANARAAEGTPGASPRLRVLAAAVPPASRSWPPSPKVVLPAALLIGMMLGGILAVVVGARRERVFDTANAGARSFRATDA